MPARKAKIMVGKSKKKEAKEMTRLGKALRALGGMGGEALGSYVGQGIGGRSLGTSLGASLSRWLGAGAYHVASNSLLAPGVPAMHTNGQVVRVVHKEYIGPVIGSQDFSVHNTYRLNPSDMVTFPWLYRIAKCYQQYTIKGAVFHYIPTSGVAVSGSNPAIGSVMMQTSYRSTDSPPESKVELLNEYWSSEGPPNESFVHPIECDPKENPFQIHYVGQPSGDQDRLMYDLGETYIATQGMPGANPVGDLWVTYDVEFRKPVVRSSAVDTFEVARGGKVDVSAEAPLTGLSWSGIDMASEGNVMRFPKGSTGAYWVLFDITPSSGNFTAADFGGAAACVNCSETEYTRTQLVSAAGASVVHVYRSATVKVSADTAPATYTLPVTSFTPSLSLTIVVTISRYA